MNRIDFASLDKLRRVHPGWRLLAADSAPLVISFLYEYFIQPNVRAAAQEEIVARLDDHLFRLREQLGEQAFPRTARAYLDEWASDSHGWLRKYYPSGEDEPHFDLSPATEKAIEWLASLERRHFVATESRLLMVFELLRQMAQGTEEDPGARIADLERRRAKLDGEIARIRAGQLDFMDATQIRDRFAQMADTARALLSDFRAVDQNFRDLDRGVRERIATWEGSKGELLEEIFGERDAIRDSDQGKSFRAFWDFLMSQERQGELSRLLEAVFGLPAVQALAPDRRILRVHYDWLEAGEIAQRTVARLSEQLRRYLDDRTWLENRRIVQLLREIEQHALRIRDSLPEGTFMELPAFAPDIELPFERPLHAPAVKPRITEQPLPEGDSEVAADALFEQVYVDRSRLAANLRRVLQTRSQVSLAEVVAEAPLEQGLAELVTYLSIATNDEWAVIDDERTQTLSWIDAGGAAREATMPLIVFVRGER